MSDRRRDGAGWDDTERRGRVLVEEARCRASANGPLDVRWLTSAASWLAEVAPAWEDMAGDFPVERTYRPICSSMDIEAWLIAWPAGGRLELHDHGGAGGGLRVVSGRVLEEFATAGPPQPGGTRALTSPLRRRVLGVGRGTGFGASRDGGSEYVHDVINLDGPVATSVHVYGPATRAMGFYRCAGAVLTPIPACRDSAAIVSPGAGLHIG